MTLVYDADPNLLASAGWGVIFAPEIEPSVEEAVRPLLAQREAQAGKSFKRYRYRIGQTKDQFLADHGAGSGPADPAKLPYYLLIIGSPDEVPFRFQYELDVQYAVGRIHFDAVEHYAAYARNVVEAEWAAASGSPSLPPREIQLFGVRNGHDEAMQQSTRELLVPLADQLRKERPAKPVWSVQVAVGDGATREDLCRLMGGPDAPALLLTATHGLGYPPDDPLQRQFQGALVCQEWPGPNQEIQRHHLFAGEDVAETADFRGRITFHFACYSAGTPAFDSVGDLQGPPRRITAQPFVSALAKRLLSHPRGALAVVGHVDRAWTTSFSWSEGGQVQLFENTFKRLIDGFPIGFAMEYFNERYAELAVQHSELSYDKAHYLPIDSVAYARSYRGSADARNFVVVGDPAVRLVTRAGR